MSKKRGTGLMPNRAAKELLEAVDSDIDTSVAQAVQAGVLSNEEANLRRTRMHIARMDRWFSLLDNIGEKK